MLRKDVKLGFAIGGVLLAVLVVYVLVGTGGNKNRGGAEIATDDTSAATTPKNATEVTAPKVDRSIATASANTAPTHGGVTDPATRIVPAPTTAPAVADATGSAAKDPNKDLWESTLSKGELLMTQTPSPTRGGDTPGGGAPDRSTDASAPANNSTLSSRTAAAAAPIPAAATPATQPTHDAGAVIDPLRAPGTAAGSTSARTHVIQKGETLAKISQAAYGSPNYYPHILRANPTIDPAKLKPGTTINLPPVSEVKPAADATSTTTTDHAAVGTASAPAATIDPRTQYKVESGDSLYKISMKLYGKAELVDKIYDLNKDAIGADRAKLKLNMLLKLPQPPTETAAATR